MDKQSSLSAKLGVGPMSSEIIEAVFRFSHYHRQQLMLIASKNQIDYAGGYVNNWTTADYMEFVKKLRDIYPNSDVKICRDHCGPGFNGLDDLQDTYKTAEDDIKNNFDLIHIDFCHFKGMRDEKLAETKKIIEHCLKLNPNILLEIGTDENFGANYSLPNLREISDEIAYLKSFCQPEFYVVQTGTVIKEINQAGAIKIQFVEEISKLLKSQGLKLKEHNADYLTQTDITARKDLVDALNIAPQLGVVQTSIVLTKCLEYGVDFTDFMEEVWQKGKWRKWMLHNDEKNKMLCFLIAGHYHFASDHYQKIIKQLEQREDIHETLINGATDIINHYSQ